MHESGHGLYEQGLPRDYSFSPVGGAISLGVHESQSRFWENQIGRTGILARSMPGSVNIPRLS